MVGLRCGAGLFRGAGGMKVFAELGFEGVELLGEPGDDFGVLVDEILLLAGIVVPLDFQVNSNS